MNAFDVLAVKKYEPNYAIRYKVGGNPMIMGEDKIIWSLTDKYFKVVESSLARKYGDWEAMMPSDAHYLLVAAAKAGQGYLEFMGREIMIMTPVDGVNLMPHQVKDNAAKPVTRSPVTRTTLRSAGQVAEALGKAIEGYLPIDKIKADAALKELIWIAKNVSWESKANRHLFESRGTDERQERTASGNREPEGSEGGGNPPPDKPL